MRPRSAGTPQPSTPGQPAAPRPAPPRAAPDPFRHPDADGARVLVVEDDEALGTQLVRGLERAGYTASRVTTGRAAISEVCSPSPPELMLLDLGLPDMDGAEVCQQVRAASDLPIIVVTARGDEADRVAALDLGSDDYLVKPFGFAELRARMRAVPRRAGRAARAAAGAGHAAGDGPAPPGPLRHGPLEVDVRGRRVRMAGRPVALTPKEFELLAFLVSEPGRVRTRREIFAAVWGEWYGSPKVLDVHVGALRRKLGSPALIETVYGVGFRLADPQPHDPAPPGQGAPPGRAAASDGSG